MNTNETQQLERTLWDAADELTGNMSPSDYKYVVLGLIFLKYVSDSFEAQLAKYKAEGFDESDEDFLRDYLAKDNIFFVPKEARWKFLQDNAHDPKIGEYCDKAMDAIEKDNKSLRGVLPKNYGNEKLDKNSLGSLIDIFTNKLTFRNTTNATDILGRVYEYFMGMFADSEGKNGGEFYTPRSIVRLLVAMIQPFKGRVYDPCCGSGGMFVSSEDFVKEHQGRLGDIAIYGQEWNQTTWQLAKMNMAIRGIDADIREGNTLDNDRLKDLKFDFILANPPFNRKWHADKNSNDVRFADFGLPPAGNSNYAWISHIIHHLSPKGVSGFVMANGTMTSNTSGEGDIRRRIVEGGLPAGRQGLVDCIIACPDKLFFNVTLPCCLWFVSRNRANRKGKTLFIDARKLGHMESRKTRNLSESDIAKITAKYHEFIEHGTTADEPGFAKVATLDEIRKNDFALTPGLCVGSEAVADDGDLPAPRPGLFFVYAIRCDDESIYIGQTDDIARRWKEHKSGQGAEHTKKHKPVKIVHYEEYATREEAVEREKELKTTNGRRWLNAEIAAGRARQAGLDEQIAALKAELLAGFTKGRELKEKIIKNLENL